MADDIPHKSNVTVYLDDRVIERLRADAAADHRSMSNFVERMIVERYAELDKSRAEPDS